MAQIEARTSLDCAPLTDPLERLLRLLEVIPEPSGRRLLDAVAGYLDRLGSDVSPCQCAIAKDADGTLHISYGVLVGAEFESLLATFEVGGSGDSVFHGGAHAN